MPKKRISNVDLNWLITERLRHRLKRAKPIPIAVVPDKKLGWRVVVGGEQNNALAVRKLQLIESELRLIYSLAAD